MTNPRVLFEYVPLVRQLLAASERSDVATLGKLGEISYLVEQEITPVDLQIIGALMASASSGGRGGFARRRLQAYRDALEPHLGKHLLKAGLECASRQYEVYVDPVASSVVYLGGFDVPAEEPEEVAGATPAERARWILDHRHGASRDDGRRVVDLLLAGRDVAELSLDELELLARGYNWWGQNAKAFEIAKVALARAPYSTPWLDSARLYLWNAYLNDLPKYLTACDQCIAIELGPPAFWHMVKADQFLLVATGESELEDFEWSPEHPILHPEFLPLAAAALEAALRLQPGLNEDDAAPEWVGDWNSRFAALLQHPGYAHLRR